MAARAEPAARARVLVVEDEPVVADLLARMLTGEGYRVEAVGRADDAMERLERGGFDLVLLDLDLPGAGGMEVLSAAPALRADASFVVMTAFGSVDTAVEAIKRGAFDHVHKPFRTEELLLTLERAAQDREARRLATAPPPDERPGDDPSTGAGALLERADDGGWTLERLEREHILRVLRRAGGHRGRAAVVLGIHPRTLSRKLREYAARGVLPAGFAAGDEP